MSSLQTDLSRLTFDEEKHRYYLDGVAVPGVTTIIGMYKTVKVGDLLYKINPFKRQAIDYDIMVAAAEKGKAIHKGAELLFQGHDLDWDNLPEIIVPPLQSVAKWIEMMKPKYIASEFMGFSEVPKPYAGQPDLVLEFANKLYEIDMKSFAVGKHDLWPIDVQTKAYEPFVRAYLGTKKKIHRAVLSIPKVGSPCHVQELNNPKSKAFFEWKLNEYYFLKEQGVY